MALVTAQNQMAQTVGQGTNQASASMQNKLKSAQASGNRSIPKLPKQSQDQATKPLNNLIKPQEWANNPQEQLGLSQQKQETPVKVAAPVSVDGQIAQSVKQETNTTSKSTKTHNNTSKNNHQLNSYNELIETVTARHIDDPARTAIGDYAPISTIPAFVAEYLKEKGDNTDHDGLLYISDKRIVHSLHEKRSNYDAVTLKAFKDLPELLAKLGISDDELLGYYYQYAKGRHALIIVVQNTEPIKEEALISNEKRYCAFIFHIQKGKYFLTTVRKYSVNDLNNLTKIK